MGKSSAPEGYSSVSPHLVVEGAKELLGVMVEVFGGEEVQRIENEDGTLAHGEVRIGNSLVMIGEARNPPTPLQTMLYVYVKDAEATYRRALEAGLTSFEAPADQPYGDRRAGVRDLAGNQRFVATKG